MSTSAEKAVASGKVPSNLAERAEEVSATCAQGHTDADSSEELAQKREDHGLHAYSYEQMGDGSVLALWANDADGTVQMKAFADIDEASKWTPRDER